METTLLHLNKKAVFSELFEDPADGFNVGLAKVSRIDQGIAQIHGTEDIELFGEDLDEVALEADRSVGKSERHDLELEMIIPSPERSSSIRHLLEFSSDGTRLLGPAV